MAVRRNDIDGNQKDGIIKEKPCFDILMECNAVHFELGLSR